LNGSDPHFRWISHGLIERQGREWAQLSFARKLPPPESGEAYMRSICTVFEGHLLQVWARSHAGEKAAADRIIDSLQISL
jgi:hypothetical protein